MRGQRRFAATLFHLPRSSGHPCRHAVQPGTKRFSPPNRVSPQGQNQKRRLERILGGMPVSECPVADREHHRPVAPDDLLEGCLAGPGLSAGKPLKKLAVAGSGQDPELKQGFDVSVDHDRPATRRFVPDLAGLTP